MTSKEGGEAEYVDVFNKESDMVLLGINGGSDRESISSWEV